MKRLISSLLIAMFLISFIPSHFAAFAQDGAVISYVELTDCDIVPIADAAPEDYTSYTVGENVSYTVSRDYWRDETANTAYFTIFERENTYRRCFELTPDEGYCFTKDTVAFLNGSMDNCSSVELKSDGTLRVWSLYQVAGMGWQGGYLFYDNFDHFNPKWWARYDLDFDNECFSQGRAADGIKVYEGEGCLIDRTANPYDEEFNEDSLSSHEFHCLDGAILSWYHMSQQTSEPEPYTICVQMAESPLLWDLIQVWDGTAPMNDYEKVEVDLSQFAGKDIRIVIQHHGVIEDGILSIDLMTVTDSTYTAIGSVNMKKALVYPVIGESPADNYYYSPDADKHYTVTNHYWYDETAHTKSFDKFEQGHVYSSCFVLTPHEHYYLSSDTVINVNGTETDIKVMNCDGSLTFHVKNAAMTERPIIAGDADDDMDITTADAVIILKITIDMFEPTDRQRKAADANGNGKVTTADATYVLKQAAGMI